MGKYAIEEDTLNGIAENIQGLTLDDSKMTAEQMLSKFEEIKTNMDNIFRSAGMLVIPEGVTEIRYRMFADLTTVTGVKLPKSLTHLCERAFYNCDGIEEITIPENVDIIDAYALGYIHLTSGSTVVTTLSKVTFKGTPTTIASTAFSGDHGLKTINVPWAEGEVPGAPWGAPNTTINYNYSGG